MATLVWTSATTGTTVEFLSAAASATKAVAVSSTGKVFASSNVSSWTEKTSGTTKRLNGIAYGNGRFVAVGADGTIIVSDDDGETWSSKSVSTSRDFRSVATNGSGIWVAGTEVGNCRRSTDNGETWSSEISTGTIDGNNGDMIWTGSYFIIGLGGSLSRKSTDGSSDSWSSAGITTGGTILTVSGGAAIAVGYSSLLDEMYIAKSTNGGSVWTAATLSNVLSSPGTAAATTGHYGIAGNFDPDIVWESTDGVNWISEDAPNLNRTYNGGGALGERMFFVGSLGSIIYKDFFIAPGSGSVFLDSCQRYNDASEIGYQYPTNSGATVSKSVFRVRQDRSIALAAGGYIQKEFSTDWSTVIMGAAVYLTGYPASDQLLFQMRDGLSESVGLYLTSTGMLKIKNGSATFLTGATAIEIDRFVYVELLALIDDAAGLLQMWIHNTNETYTASIDEQDTNRTTNGIVDNIRWCGPVTGTYMTSLYCLSWEAPYASASHFGNIEIHAYRPKQDASNVGCLPNVGTTLSPAVDEVTPVLDDYVYLSATDSPPDKYRLLHEPFVFPNPETSQTILAAQIVGLLANGNADSPPVDADFSFFWGYGSAVGNGDVQTVVADNSWLYYTQGYVENPATSAAWSSDAELNEFTWGVEHE